MKLPLAAVHLALVSLLPPGIARADEPAPATAPAPAAAPPPAPEAPDSPFRLPVAIAAALDAGWHTDRDYGELFGRLNLSRAQGPWQAALRVDTATFVSPPSDEVADRYSLEKLSAGWTGRSLEVTAGDSYLTVGRGMALSLRKLDELGIDTTVRGGKLLLHQGPFGGTLAAGYANINNVDQTTGTGVDDTYDLISAAQGQVTLGERVALGGYGAAVAFRDSLGLVPSDHYTDRSYQLGVTVDGPRLSPHVGLYLEGMAQALRTEPAASDQVGFGLYGTATGYFGPATLLFEGKAYGALTPLHPDLENPAFDAVAYNNPPTVERVLQVIENPQRDIAGGRLRLDWTFCPGLIGHVNYGFFRDFLGYADPETMGEIKPGTIQDPYAGVEVRWDQARSFATTSAGWRTVNVDDSHDLVRGDGHVEVEASEAVGDRVSLTLQWIDTERRKRESALLDESFREGTLLVGVRLQPLITVAGGYDYTTEPTQPRRDYWNGNVAWDITQSSSLRLFVGSARGGLKCVSGVCRVVPPFEGVKLTATLRF